MPKPSAKPTSAANLEAKFDAGEDVLDYFDLRGAKVARPSKNVKAATRKRASRIDRALEIAAQIEKLGSELRSILGVQHAK
jgi:hypothetical protein